MENLCPACGTPYSPGNRFCRSCGTQLPEPLPTSAPAPQLVCPRCHSVNDPGAVFCYSCGLPFVAENRPRPATMFPAGRPAGFWIRVVAALIDGGVLFLVSLLLGALWPGVNPLELPEPPPEGGSTGPMFVWTTLDTVGLVIAAAYYTFSVSIWSTTIGKRVVGIYIFRPDGSSVGVMRAFCRYLAGHMSFLLLFAGYLMIAFRQDKRGLHDLLCDTVVVYRQ